MKILKNYFFSGLPSRWIENLGVDPWLSLFAFLLLPALTLLLDRILLVTLVLETITLLQRGHKYITRQVLTLSSFFVKIFLCFLCLSDLCMAKDLVLAIGQHMEIPTKELEKFTVTNSAVLSYKHNQKKKILLIKGLKQGLSEVILWPTRMKKKTTYRVYVISKKEHLKKMEDVSSLRRIGLQAELQGPTLFIQGQILRIQDFQLFHQIALKYPGSFHQEITLSKNLIKSIKSEIYHDFFQEHIDQIFCRTKRGEIRCTYPSSFTPSKTILTKYQKKFGVHFLKQKNRYHLIDYRIRLKIIQLERLDGKEIDFGISKLEGKVEELMAQGPKYLLYLNNFKLGEVNAQISTLAEPEMIIQLGSPAQVQVGADIPYQSITKDQTQTTEWKFAGLKVKLSLLERNGSLQLAYQSEISRPGASQGQISGTKQSSSIKIPIGKPVSLFQIGFRTIGKSTESIPWLARIPILGALFSSSNKQNNFKRITGLVQIEEVH